MEWISAFTRSFDRWRWSGSGGFKCKLSILTFGKCRYKKITGPVVIQLDKTNIDVSNELNYGLSYKINSKQLHISALYSKTHTLHCRINEWILLVSIRIFAWLPAKCIFLNELCLNICSHNKNIISFCYVKGFLSGYTLC